MALAGGMESMSQVPYFLRHARRGGVPLWPWHLSGIDSGSAASLGRETSVKGLTIYIYINIHTYIYIYSRIL